MIKIISPLHGELISRFLIHGILFFSRNMSSLLVGMFQQVRLQSRIQARFTPASQLFSTTDRRGDLNEFFEEEKVRGEDKEQFL